MKGSELAEWEYTDMQKAYELAYMYIMNYEMAYMYILTRKN